MTVKNLAQICFQNFQLSHQKCLPRWVLAKLPPRDTTNEHSVSRLSAYRFPITQFTKNAT